MGFKGPNMCKRVCNSVCNCALQLGGTILRVFLPLESPEIDSSFPLTPEVQTMDGYKMFHGSGSGYASNVLKRVQSTSQKRHLAAKTKIIQQLQSNCRATVGDLVCNFLREEGRKTRS